MQQMSTTPKSTDQLTTATDNSNTVADVRLAFALCKVQFEELKIKQPLAFIRWRRPHLTADEVRRIRMGLTGRAAGTDGHLAEMCKEVIDELKSAA